MQITLTIEFKEADINAMMIQVQGNDICRWARDIMKYPTGGYCVTLKQDHAYHFPPTFQLDIERGLKMMARFPFGGGSVYDLPKSWNGNARDAFVQYAAFGELRYK